MSFALPVYWNVLVRFVDFWMQSERVRVLHASPAPGGEWTDTPPAKDSGLHLSSAAGLPNALMK